MLLLALANGAYILTAYAVTTVTARLLDPADFGSFGVVMAWITIVTALLVKGLATSTAREMAAGEVAPSTAWHAGRSLGVRLSVGIAALAIAASPVAARVFGTSALTDEFMVGALGALTFGVNAVLLAWPTGERQYGRQALAQVAYAIARLALVVGGAATFGLHGAVAGYVLAPLLATAPILMRHPAADAPIGPVRARMQRSIVPIAVVSIAVTAYFVVDVFALSGARGDSSRSVGTYVAYGTIAHVPFFLLQAASVAMVPALAATRIAAARSAAIRRTMSDTIVLLAGPTLLLASCGDAAARIVFGDDYRVADPVVLPLALATGAVTILANLVAVDVALGRLRTSLVLAISGAALVAAGCAWAARIDTGATAANVAWAACVASVIACLALAIQVRVRHGALLDLHRTAAGTLLAVVVAAPPLLASGDVARVLVGGVCGLAWLALVLRLGLVDVRRSGAGAGVAVVPDPEHA
jgi:O-antigen/teichoic acid export membrane protein